MRRIVLPQAMRVIIPPTGNETISMLKTTSLVSVIAVRPSCSTRCSSSTRSTIQTIPLLIVASIWYLIVTTVLTIGQYYLERHFGRGRDARPAGDAAASDCVDISRPARDRRVPESVRRATMSAPMVKAEGVHKRFGRLEVLKGISLEVAAGRGRLPARPVGLGQVDVPALHQPPREDRRRPAVGRRRARRLPRRRGDKLYELRDAEVAGERAEIGMVFQRFNLFPHMTALENVIEAPVRVQEGAASARPSRAGRALLDRVGPRRQARRATRRSSPAASSSASRSRARWRWSRS